MERVEQSFVIRCRSLTLNMYCTVYGDSVRKRVQDAAQSKAISSVHASLRCLAGLVSRVFRGGESILNDALLKISRHGKFSATRAANVLSPSGCGTHASHKMIENDLHPARWRILEEWKASWRRIPSVPLRYLSVEVVVAMVPAQICRRRILDA